MPKITRELTVKEVERLRAEGAHAVGGVPGLYLQILGGSRSWVYRFVIASGTRRRMGLGPYPLIPLAKAREKAREARALVADGRDPITERADEGERAAAAQARAITFKKACALYIAAREEEWRSSKHRQQWENTLETYAEPVLGSMDVAAIDQDHVLKVLEPIWRKKTETASRVRSRIEIVLDWATARRHRKGENPARWRGHLDKLLPAPGKIREVRHHPAVPVADVPAVVREIAAKPGVAARALLLQVLTALRSGEVRGARWPEFELSLGVWNVPAERMKGKRPHRVPLSEQALQLLAQLPRYEQTDLLFPSQRDTMLSDMSLTSVMRRMKLEAVPHGFRSSFRDWGAELTSYPNELLEMALSHAIESKVEAAYRRGDMMARRLALMQDWADYCLGPPLAKKIVSKSS